MSREIKFRAWDKNRHGEGKGGWIKPASTASFGTADNQNLLASDNGDVVLVQYTGLHDCNGVEIYEGDIVRWRNSKGREVVTWDSERGKFVTDNDYEETNWSGCEVIGNIYENPELLEAGDA